jgi:arsenate reductase
MSEITIWHNPRCSKSRQTLALLTERGIVPTIRLYLEDPPDVTELRQLLDLLGQPVAVLLRKGEADYKEHFAGLAGDMAAGLAGDMAACLELLSRYPKVIERPVVIVGNRAVLGRPPENVLALL